jgi:hypothetical protein
MAPETWEGIVKSRLDSIREANERALERQSKGIPLVPLASDRAFLVAIVNDAEEVLRAAYPLVSAYQATSRRVNQLLRSLES